TAAGRHRRLPASGKEESDATPRRRSQPGFFLRRGRAPALITGDTSALMAIALEEPAGQLCAAVLAAGDESIISAGTLAEFLIVASGRGLYDDAARVVADLGLVVIPLTAQSAKRAAQAYQRWGKGYHAAHLNLGDCFAYALAADQGCPLL